MAAEHAYAPAKHNVVVTKNRAFHCLPETSIANPVDNRAMIESVFFHVSKDLTTLLHSLQWITCRKYLLFQFGVYIVPSPPLAGDWADNPATRPAGACSTTAGIFGGEMVLCPK